MAQKQAASKKPNKAAAARAEKNAKGKTLTLTWRGVKLKLPAADEVSGAFLFANRDVERRDDFSSVLGIVESFTGRDQLVMIEQQVAGEGLNIQQTIDAIGELLEAIFGKYGMAAGE